MDESNESALVAQGRRIVSHAAIAIVLVSVATNVAIVMQVGFDRIGIQLVRFALTLALARYLLLGREWARWTTVALLTVTILIGIPTVAKPDAYSGAGAAATVGLLAMLIVYAVTTWRLLPSPSLQAYYDAVKSQDAGRDAASTEATIESRVE